MIEMKYVDQKTIDQAVRNAHQIRSEEFLRVVTSMGRGVKALFSAIREGVQAGRKAHDIT